MRGVPARTKTATVAGAARPGTGPTTTERAMEPEAREEPFHEPVLVEETLDLLLQGGEGLYLDGTVGGGGHARALLERCAGCRLVAVDRDPEALRAAGEALDAHRQRVRLVRARFDRAVEKLGVEDGALAGALLDLGVSSHQLDSGERGFTFRRGAPLDMRMGADEADGPTAADLLNEADEGRLAEIFRELGEEPRGRALAREVVRRRRNRPFRTSDDLVAALAAVLDRGPRPREKARIFQGLRIAVNEELVALENGLERIRDALRPGGVIAVLAYHSLEDRVVKHAFREWSRSCVCPPRLPVCRCRGEPLGGTLTRSPVRPGEEETARNPRARSARLRAWRKAS